MPTWSIFGRSKEWASVTPAVGMLIAPRCQRRAARSRIIAIGEIALDSGGRFSVVRIERVDGSAPSRSMSLEDLKRKYVPVPEAKTVAS